MTPEATNPPFVGVLMLDTVFPRVLGDAGNTASYKVPARAQVVTGIGSLDVVNDRILPERMTEAFCAAARELEIQGARAIVSTCGFLVTAQDRIDAAVDIPVVVSGLSYYRLLKAQQPERQIGILTASKSSLGPAALQAAGIEGTCTEGDCIESSGPLIAGLEDCEAFRSAILSDKSAQPSTLDTKAIRTAIVGKAVALADSCPALGAFVLECGNLPPYAEDIRSATGKPVYSILDAAHSLFEHSELRTITS